MDPIGNLHLPDELIEAAKEINEPETVEGKKAAISAFLLQTAPFLRHDDRAPSVADALKYLRLRKFRLDEAVATYCNRVAFFREHAAILANIQLQDFHDLYADSFVRVLPGRDRHGRRVLCMRTRKPSRFQLDVLLLRWLVYCLDVLSEDVYFQVNGLVLVQNLSDIKLKDAMHVAGLVRTGKMSKLFYYLQECSPARVAHIFILKPPRFVSIVWNLLRLLLKPKTRDRVEFCPQMEILHNVIDPSVLPPLWGGTSEEDPWTWYKAQEEAQKIRESFESSEAQEAYLVHKPMA